MKRRLLLISIGLLLACGAFADPTVVARKATATKEGEEKLVFLTGSLIPQRVQLRAIGTTTVSPIRIIDRREIDRTDRSTTPGVFANDPAVAIVGH